MNHEKEKFMITIHELLNRIRWDREYGRGDFAIGYFDHIEQRMVVVPLSPPPSIVDSKNCPVRREQ